MRNSFYCLALILPLMLAGGCRSSYPLIDEELDLVNGRRIFWRSEPSGLKLGLSCRETAKPGTMEITFLVRNESILAAKLSKPDARTVILYVDAEPVSATADGPVAAWISLASRQCAEYVMKYTFEAKSRHTVYAGFARWGTGDSRPQLLTPKVIVNTYPYAASRFRLAAKQN